jgi:hypothetical protein
MRSEAAYSLRLKLLSNSLVRWWNFRLNFMQGAVADVGAALRLDVHKAIPKVSPELVDRLPAENF